MSFKLINRLLWLVVVTTAATAVLIAGLFALIIGVDSARVTVVTIVGLAAVVLVLWLGVLTHLRPAHSQRQDAGLALAPWYSNLPGALPPAGSADPGTLPPYFQPSMETTPASGTALDSLADTHPMRRVQIQEPPIDALEDTQPRQAARPKPARRPAMRGPYDDLFPPPQPEDEDYLECEHDLAPLLPHDETPEEPATTPTLPISTRDPAEIDPMPDAPDDPMGDQTAPSGGEAPISPGNPPA
jgi:hypothetical protein